MFLGQQQEHRLPLFASLSRVHLPNLSAVDTSTDVTTSGAVFHRNHPLRVLSTFTLPLSWTFHRHGLVRNYPCPVSRAFGLQRFSKM